MSDVELYEFRRGPVAWLYARSRRAVVLQQRTFLPATIKRTEITQSSELQRCNLDLTVPLDLPVLSALGPVAPIDKISVLVRVLPRGETVARGIWGGVVANVEDNDHQAILHCLPPSSAIRTSGLSECWQKNCRHMLFGPGCGASREAARTDGTLTGVTTNTITAAAFVGKATDWFAGGYVQWTTAQGLVEWRWILNSDGDTGTLTLLTPSNVSVGTTVAAYSGCNHTADDCDTKHNNMPNYGGQLHIPPQVPFGNNPGF